MNWSFILFSWILGNFILYYVIVHSEEEPTEKIPSQSFKLEYQIMISKSTPTKPKAQFIGTVRT